MRTGLPPAALMTHTWYCPDRRLVNAIFDPSGDQVGSKSVPAELVRRVVTPVTRSGLDAGVAIEGAAIGPSDAALSHVRPR